MGEARRRELTYEEQADIRHRRERAFDQFRIIGWVLLNCCLLSLTVGVVILVVGQNSDAFPIRSGSPIWSALVVAFACAFAFIVGCYNPHYFREKDGEKLQTWILVYIISAVLSVIVCLISFSFTVYGTVRCVTWKNQYGQLVLMCGSNYDVQIVMHVAAFLLSLFMIIFLIYGIVLYFVYKDVYPFYYWEIGYYHDYYYTVPGERRVIETNPHYVTSDRIISSDKSFYYERDPRYVTSDRYYPKEKPHVIESLQYVNAEKKPTTGSIQYSLKGDDDTQPADVISEYDTSKHKYLVLRFDRNQIRPI